MAFKMNFKNPGSILKMVAPLAAMIPGIGPLAAGALGIVGGALEAGGASGSISKGGAKEDAKLERQKEVQEELNKDKVDTQDASYLTMTASFLTGE